jgi:hypothetical protein
VHSGRQVEVPRSYMTELEAQVADLTRQLNELRSRGNESAADANAVLIGDNNSPSGVSPDAISNGGQSVAASSSSPHDLVRSMGLVVSEPSKQPRFFGTSSGITLAKMVMASIRCDNTSTPRATETQQIIAPQQAIQSSLPPRDVAGHILDVYFQFRTPHFPIFDRSRIERAIEKTYDTTSVPPPSDASHSRDIFITFMVMAVGLFAIPGATGRRSSQSEGCFHSATQYLDSVLIYSASELETLGMILLLAQYVSLCPSMGDLWQLTGIALRQCVDIGLHWETEPILSLPAAILSQRRRLFWAAYRFDRLLAITLGRPPGIADQSLNVEYPNPYLDSDGNSSADDIGIHNQRVANHLTHLSRLESEIKHVLYHQLKGATLAYPRANYALWSKDIQFRLREWQATIPSPDRAHNRSIFANEDWWKAIYNDAVSLLHRPNPLIPYPSAEALRTCFDSSSKSIDSIKLLQREQKIDTPWIWVHRLFISGLACIYCVWHAPDIRESVAVENIIGSMQSCATTLSALCEQFPGATGCRDAIDMLSAEVTKWLVRKNADDTEETRPSFGLCLQALQQQSPRLFCQTPTEPLSFGEDVFSFLSNNTLNLGESLNHAAQWELPETVDFSFSFD